MHELAGCRVSTPSGDVAGYVLGYDGGVLRMQTHAPPSGLRVGEPVDVTVLDPVRGVCTYNGVAGTIDAAADGTALDVVVLEDVARHQRRAAARAPYRCSCVAMLKGARDALYRLVLRLQREQARHAAAHR